MSEFSKKNPFKSSSSGGRNTYSYSYTPNTSTTTTTSSRSFSSTSVKDKPLPPSLLSSNLNSPNPNQNQNDEDNVLDATNASIEKIKPTTTTITTTTTTASSSVPEIPVFNYKGKLLQDPMEEQRKRELEKKRENDLPEGWIVLKPRKKPLHPDPFMRTHYRSSEGGGGMKNNSVSEKVPVSDPTSDPTSVSASVSVSAALTEETKSSIFEDEGDGEEENRPFSSFINNQSYMRSFMKRRMKMMKMKNMNSLEVDLDEYDSEISMSSNEEDIVYPNDEMEEIMGGDEDELSLSG